MLRFSSKAANSRLDTTSWAAQRMKTYAPCAQHEVHRSGSEPHLLQRCRTATVRPPCTSCTTWYPNLPGEVAPKHQACRYKALGQHPFRKVFKALAFRPAWQPYHSQPWHRTPQVLQSDLLLSRFESVCSLKILKASNNVTNDTDQIMDMP